MNIRSAHNGTRRSTQLGINRGVRFGQLRTHRYVLGFASKRTPVVRISDRRLLVLGDNRVERRGRDRAELCLFLKGHYVNTLLGSRPVGMRGPIA